MAGTTARRDNGTPSRTSSYRDRRKIERIAVSCACGTRVAVEANLPSSSIRLPPSVPVAAGVSRAGPREAGSRARSCSSR